MTTPNGAIKFNATSGSDTAASGLGPATALTGSGASTDGTAIVTGISTTGASAGDLLWVQTASGRQFSVIASVDSSTQVTCDDTFALGTGQTWAIGGKRATFENASSRQLFQDVKAAMTIETETDQSVTSMVSILFKVGSTTTGYITLRGDSATTKRVFDCSALDPCIGGNGDWTYWRFENLKFTNSYSGSKTGVAAAIRYRGSVFFCLNCTFGDSTNQLWTSVTRYTSSATAKFVNCIIEDCIGPGLQADNVNLSPTLVNCIVRNNGTYGSAIHQGSISGCLIYGNASHGISTDGTTNRQGTISNNVIYGNSGDGIRLNNTANAFPGFSITDNIIVGNTGYGVGGSLSGSDDNGAFVDRNAFYNNTSGNYQNLISGPNDITLTADPFTDAAAADFTINSDAGGGSTLRSAANTLASTETRPFRWLDAAAAGIAAVFSYVANFTRLG